MQEFQININNNFEWDISFGYHSQNSLSTAMRIVEYLDRYLSPRKKMHSLKEDTLKELDIAVKTIEEVTELVKNFTDSINSKQQETEDENEVTDENQEAEENEENLEPVF